jgi:predicted ATPase
VEGSANLEAIAHLKRGIEILMRLPESRERDEQELLLQATLIVPFYANEGPASAAAERAATRARELGGRIGANSPAQIQAVSARRWLALAHTVRGERRTGLAIAEEGLGLARPLGDSVLLSGIHHLTGLVYLHLGNLTAARLHLEDGLALYDPERDRAKAARFGYDARTVCHSHLALALWPQGFPDRALGHAEEAIAAGRAAAHPISEAHALSYAAVLHQLRGEVTLCLERAEATLALSTEQLLPYWAAFALVVGGWALTKNDQAEKGLARLRAGIDAYCATGTKFGGPHSLLPLAEACLTASRIEEGLSAAREGLAVVEETAACYCEAELNRLEGQLLLASEEPDEKGAEVSFRKAIEIARAQQAKSFELRAAASLARLLTRQGRREEARALLAPIYGWFTEGFDTADLKEAKGLLNGLR